jgi:hypothetical protein
MYRGNSRLAAFFIKKRKKIRNNSLLTVIELENLVFEEFGVLPFQREGKYKKHYGYSTPHHNAKV